MNRTANPFRPAFLSPVSPALALACAALLAPAATAQLGMFDHTSTLLVPPLPSSYYSGACWGDVNGDGFEDLYVTNYYGPNHLFLNLPVPLSSPPARHLVDMTPPPLTDPAGHGEGAVFADFDNDGDLDLYVVNAGGSANKLFANLGSGMWADVSAGSGVAYSGIGEGCAVADFDGDGWLDLYLLNYGATPGGEIDHWFKNLGGLTFIDVTPAVAATAPMPGGACAFADYDGDGDMDLFVGNDGAPNRLWENRGAAGWVDVTSVVGGATLADATSGCFGARWIDYDHDGDLDLYLSNSASFHGTTSTNKLFRNSVGPLGTRLLTLVTSGADDTGSGMAVTSGDFDGDGDEDLAMANFGANKLYVGGATPLPFATAPASFFTDMLLDMSSSVTRCDFDHDGDMDLFFGGSTLRVFENVRTTTVGGITVGGPARTVTVNFRGDDVTPFGVPRDGHGTSTQLFVSSPLVVSPAGGLPRGVQQVDGGSGYAQDAPACAWTLPAPADSYRPEHLQVTWADGSREALVGLPKPTTAVPDQRLTVHYPAGVSSYGAVALTTLPLSRASMTNDITPAQVGAAHWALAAGRCADGWLGLLAVGFTPISAPTPFGTLLVDPALLLVSLASDGYTKWSLPLPTDPSIAGITLYNQAFVFEAPGVVHQTAGLATTIQP